MSPEEQALIDVMDSQQRVIWAAAGDLWNVGALMSRGAAVVTGSQSLASVRIPDWDDLPLDLRKEYADLIRMQLAMVATTVTAFCVTARGHGELD